MKLLSFSLLKWMIIRVVRCCGLANRESQEWHSISLFDLKKKFMSWSFRVCCNLLVTCLHIIFSPAPCSLWSSYKDVALLLLELVVELRNWAIILMDGAGGNPSTHFSPGADSVSRGQLQGNAATTGATVRMMLWCVLFVYVHVLMGWCIAEPLHVNYTFSSSTTMYALMICEMH
jgi:hypothetical protein